MAVVPNGTAPALNPPYLPGQYTEYPAAVQGWAQQALPGGGSGIESGSKSGSGSKFQEVFDLADNYTLSDDTFDNHILDRHGPNSTYGNKSHLLNYLCKSSLQQPPTTFWKTQ